jgi:hypothetical protein
LRPNPHQIQVGDSVVIPDKQHKGRSVTLGANHKVKLVPPTPLHAEIGITFLDTLHSNEPVSGLTVETTQDTKRLPPQVTDASGTITLKEPDIKQGVVEILAVRDKRVQPEINYDHFILPGKEYPSGQSQMFALRVLRLPIALARSKKRPRLTATGNLAPDITCGDYTLAEVLAIPGWGWDAETIRSKSRDDLFADMRDLLTDFSMGDLEDNVLRMADRFRANVGGEYSDPVLTTAVRNHPSTGRFVAHIKVELEDLLRRHGGDPTSFRPDNPLVLNGEPRYNELTDKAAGLMITMNGIWAYDVDLTSYSQSGNSYTGKFRLTIYDHFGLDESDIGPGKTWGNLEGFRAWFLLQHLNTYGHVPLVTRIDLDCDFNGTIP